LSRNAKIVIGIALVAGLLTFVSFQRDIGAARARAAFGSELVETPCGVIEFAVEGDGPPLLMIHGAGGGFDQSLEVGRLLIDSGFRLIAMSRFGYLRTPLPADASPPAQADAHACLLDALDLDTVHVVGASLGAPSAIQFCLRHAERCTALALVVPVVYSPHEQTDALRRSTAMVRDLPESVLDSDFPFWLATKVGGRTITETLIGTPFEEIQAASVAEQDRISGLLQLALPMSARAAGLRNDVSTELPRYDLERVAVPTLVISTATDMYGTFDIARYTAGEIPGARFLGYPSGGHLWVGHHEEMLTAIADFFRSVPETRRDGGV